LSDLCVYGEKLKETYEDLSIAGVPAEIRTEHFPNVSVELHYYVSSLGYRLLSRRVTSGTSARILSKPSTSNRNEYQKKKIMFLGTKARPVRKADNIKAIYDPADRSGRSV
jgi:hypothetical protein